MERTWSIYMQFGKQILYNLDIIKIKIKHKTLEKC